MYNVSAVSLQNIYIPSTATKSSSKKDDSAAIDTVFAPLMEAVKEHQKILRKDMIDREKSELAIEEIKEILDNEVKNESAHYA